MLVTVSLLSMKYISFSKYQCTCCYQSVAVIYDRIQYFMIVNTFYCGPKERGNCFMIICTCMYIMYLYVYKRVSYILRQGDIHSARFHLYVLLYYKQFFFDFSVSTFAVMFFFQNNRTKSGTMELKFFNIKNS